MMTKRQREIFDKIRTGKRLNPFDIRVLEEMTKTYNKQFNYWVNHDDYYECGNCGHRVYKNKQTLTDENGNEYSVYFNGRLTPFCCECGARNSCINNSVW